MKLYHCPHSRSLRVIWLAEEIGLELEVQPVAFPPRLREPAYLGVHPADDPHQLGAQRHRLHIDRDIRRAWLCHIEDRDLQRTPQSRHE